VSKSLNSNDLDQITTGIEAINKVANAPQGGPFELVGWPMKEKDYKANMEKYLDGLDDMQTSSFAPLNLLIENSMDGCDLHVLAFKTVAEKHDTSNDISKIHGLIIFN